MRRIRLLSRRVVIAMAVVVLPNAGCVTVSRPAFMKPASAREWPATLLQAQQFTASGRPNAADSVLVVFAARHAGSAEAAETAYWRAVFALDPANRTTAPTTALTDAIASLDRYLASPSPRAHTLEAAALRRVAAQMDAVSRVAMTTVPTPPKEVTPASRPPESKPEPKAAAEQAAADAEIKRLKDELAKANAELERIRRRLANPPRR